MFSAILGSVLATATLAGGWVPPLTGGLSAPLTPFERPVDRFGAGHRGVDLAAEPGQDVRSIGRGVVTFVGEVAGVPSVTIDHRRVRSTYLPVRSTVSVGEQVDAGDSIGSVLASGHCLRTCLHLGVRRPVWDSLDAEADPYLDPIAWITRIPVLKPVTPGVGSMS